MKQISLWEATAERNKVRPQLKGERLCDVVIIGGGYTGLSAAYHLQEKRWETVVLEQERVGSGASGRNGGQLLPGYNPSITTIVKKWGLEDARRLLELSLQAIDLVSRLIEQQRIDCSFNRCGHLVAAYKPSHLASLKKERDLLKREFQYTVEIVEKDELRKELDSPCYYGGLIDEKSCSFHPLKYALGLAEAVESLGGTIYEHSGATGIRWVAKDKVVVSTNEGTVTAKHLIIATNGYTTALHPRLYRAVIPVESIMLATEPLEEAFVSSLIPGNRVVYDTKNLLYYFRRTPDQRIAFGAPGAAVTKRGERKQYEALRRGLYEVFPQLKGCGVEYGWRGKEAFTRDTIPYIGRLDDGTYYAFGYAGHGAAMATMLGKLLALNILAENREKTPLERIPFKTIPFHGQWARIVSLTKLYYKLLDACP